MVVYTPYIEKIYLTESIFVDIKIFKSNWQPKFSLTLVKDNQRIICFDNHEGREPHKHVKGKVYGYNFENVDKLIEDFYEEVKKFLENHEGEAKWKRNLQFK